VFIKLGPKSEVNRNSYENCIDVSEAEMMCGVLKSGIENVSLSHYLLNCPIIDMRTVRDTNAGLSDIIQILT